MSRMLHTTDQHKLNVYELCTTLTQSHNPATHFPATLPIGWPGPVLLRKTHTHIHIHPPTYPYLYTYPYTPTHPATHTHTQPHAHTHTCVARDSAFSNASTEASAPEDSTFAMAARSCVLTAWWSFSIEGEVASRRSTSPVCACVCVHVCVCVCVCEVMPLGSHKQMHIRNQLNLQNIFRR